MSKIKLLSERTINQIAAGEVVERPTSVIKELVENSLDAGASQITVELENGGHNLIRISDNGSGIAKDDLSIAVERHATSKLDESDINKIINFGFRGEALPSIASVCKLRIISKTPDSTDAWEINVNGGEKSSPMPSSREVGTTIEVRDIFSYTPARLKFLKSVKSEVLAASELINKFALANESVSFKLISNSKVIIDLKSSDDACVELQVQEIFGSDFIKNSVQFHEESPITKIHGFAGVPTNNASNSIYQHFFVNKRPVKDKLIQNAIRVAYQNLIPGGRYPKIICFLEIDTYRVDVNVHPAKTEVRFRDQNEIKDLIIRVIRNAIKTKVYQNYTPPPRPTSAQINIANDFYAPRPSVSQISSAFNEPVPSYTAPTYSPTQPAVAAAIIHQEIIPEPPLGHAKCQIANMYIISENKDGIIITDQHAAHERIVLERMKESLKNNSIQSQKLLIPHQINMPAAMVDKFTQYSEQLASLGLVYTTTSNKIIEVLETPTLMGNLALEELFHDIGEYLIEHEGIEILEEKSEYILGNMACHSSIRAGRKMNMDEMNALLRQIESTPLAEQCNHGRPTYQKMTLADLAKLFERT